LTTLDKKQQILDNAGYTYNFDREIYINRKAKKVFSVDFLEDHDERMLEECIREDTGGRKWRFYFNLEPSDSVKRELEAMLG
jgi:hypothetical protein